jgi:hypothetical protein
MKKYHAEEELVEVDDGWSGSDMDVYLASDVHAHVANIIATDSLKITQLEYRIAELEKSAERYRKLRLLNPQQHRDLWERNIREGIPFDTLVDGLGN